MSHTAIAIVLEVPEELKQSVIAFNNTLIPEEGYIHFKAQGAAPHISLAMAAISDGPLLNLIGEIISTGSAFPPVKLSVKEHTIIREGYDWPLHWLSFENERLLERMHRKMMEVIESSAISHFNRSAFANHDHESISATTQEYVKQYIDSHQLVNSFAPHITLGFGAGNVSLLPLPGTSYTFTQMGIYQLGPHCTCREPIAVFDLEA